MITRNFSQAPSEIYFTWQNSQQHTEFRNKKVSFQMLNSSGSIIVLSHVLFYRGFRIESWKLQPKLDDFNKVNIRYDINYIITTNAIKTTWEKQEILN